LVIGRGLLVKLLNCEGRKGKRERKTATLVTLMAAIVEADGRGFLRWYNERMIL
jgi:hypothetical protein